MEEGANFARQWQEEVYMSMQSYVTLDPTKTASII
jgi:hypothetical protein